MSWRRLRALTTPSLALGAAVLAAAPGAAFASASAAYAPDKVVVQYTASRTPSAGAAAAAGTAASAGAGVRVVHLARGDSVTSALSRLRRMPNVAWAVPDYVARAAGQLIPNDPGTSHTPGGWRACSAKYTTSQPAYGQKR